MNNARPLLYNPDQKHKEQLIDEFVIRQKEFMTVMNGLLESKLQTSPQHYLIVGQRGMGKTTLLLRLKYAIEDNQDLNNWLIPIKFSEEQYQIATLDSLWEEIAEHLEIAEPIFEGLLAEMEKHEDKKDYERIACDLLIKAIKKQKKRVLVMIDNLGDLFKKLGDIGNHRMREVLLGHTGLQLIGASSEMLEHTFSYDKPFFEFFQQIILQPVNKENSIKLLENLGKQYGQEVEVNKLILQNPGKIEVLRRLTGGVPRTIALLFGVFIDHQNGSTFEDLLFLLDQVNSFYKHRMDDLKPQQQRIIDALAKSWDPISSKQVLKRSKLGRDGIASNQVAAQLSVLVDNQVVEAINGQGKNKTYRIRERFFNIWYLMRYGKKQHKEEVLWLVRFLESWCNIDEMAEQADGQIKAMRQGNYSPQAAYLKTMALYHAKGIETGRKLELLEQTESYLQQNQHKAHAETIGNTKKIELENCITELLKKYDTNKELTHDDISSLPQNSLIYIVNSICERLLDADRTLIGVTDLLQAGVELDDPNCINLMGIALCDIDFDEAAKYYLQAIDKGNIPSIFNLALLYDNVNDIKSAKKYYLMAIEKGDVDAMYNTAFLYENEKDVKSAEKYYLMAINRGHTFAMFNLALHYESLKDMKLAEKYYLMAVDKGDAEAMNSLANLYKKLKNINSAEKYYLMAIDNGHTGAMFNLGLFYKKEKNDVDFAEKYYLMAADHNDKKALNNLALLYAYTKYNKKPEMAEKYFLLSHNLGNLKASVNLVRFYSVNKKTEAMLSLTDDLYSRIAILENPDWTLKIFNLVLSKKQYHFMLQQFQKPDSQLMKYARPLYYVLAWFMKDEMPGEYEKVGPEIKETVDEIIQQIVSKQKENESLVMAAEEEVLN